MSDADDVTPAVSAAPPRALVISVGGARYTVEPGDAPITVGREFPAQIQIADPRISRNHARLEVDAGGWVVVDHSTNGVFVHGVRRSSVPVGDGMTVHLGHAEGIPVGFWLEALVRDRPTGTDAVTLGDEDGTEQRDVTDVGIARAGAAVAARRRELDISQRTLAKDRIMNAGALIAFEKGRSWPRRSTLARLEQVLGWPQGSIERLRRAGDADPEPDPEPDDHTEILTNTVQAPLMAEAVEVALDAIAAQVDRLPPHSSAEFTERVGPLLADLRRLQLVAANAARTATGAGEVVRALSAVRKVHRELTLRAAQAPQATLGWRLFAARHRAQLSTEEAANAAGVSVDAIDAAEADGPLGPDVAAAVRALVASLSW